MNGKSHYFDWAIFNSYVKLRVQWEEVAWEIVASPFFSHPMIESLIRFDQRIAEGTIWSNMDSGYSIHSSKKKKLLSTGESWSVIRGNRWSKNVIHNVVSQSACYKLLLLVIVIWYNNN